ncbi:hypothetical protein Ancab_014852, partial [Ancistrocladus abbreviatus]
MTSETEAILRRCQVLSRVLVGRHLSLPSFRCQKVNPPLLTNEATPRQTPALCSRHVYSMSGKRPEVTMGESPRGSTGFRRLWWWYICRYTGCL